MIKWQYYVVVRYGNGRLLKKEPVRSKYAAKKLFKLWEDKYDETYRIAIIRREVNSDDA